MPRKALYLLILAVALLGLTATVSAETVGDAAELGEADIVIVVTASRIPQEIIASPVNISVVSREEIEAIGATTVADVLRHVEGAAVSAHGGLGGATTMSIRGSTSTQVLILRDGRRLNALQNGAFDLGRVSLNGVQQIEVIKGPASVLYGSDALGGVVNIITERGSDGGQVSLSAGSYGTRSVQFGGGTALPFGEWNLHLEKIVSDGYRPNSDYDGLFVDGSIVVDVSPSAWLTAGISYHDGEVGAPGPVAWQSLIARQKDSYTRFDFSYDQVVDSERDWSARWFQDQSIRKYNSEWEDSVHEPKTTGLEGQYNWRLYGGRHHIAVGGSYNKDVVQSTSYPGIPARDSWSLFAQDVYQYNPQLALTLGGRVDSYSDFGTEVTYRVGSSYIPVEGTRVYGAISTGFNVPTFDQLYFAGFNNPDLLPEEAFGYEVGVDRKLSPEMQVSLSAYNRVVDNYHGSDKNWIPVNLDEVVVRGGEISVDRRISPNSVLAISYEYLDARDKTANAPVNYKGRHRASAQLSWQAMETLSVTTSYRYVGTRPYVEQGALIDELPAYSVVDVNAVQAIGEELELFAKVSNLLGEQYEEVKDYPAPPRQIQVGVTYSF
ncbi:MAG: TonB-dependent receptor [Firmicutes bacterium]|nr:TonB-dependent receptor [Bacillota bacterium]